MKEAKKTTKEIDSKSFKKDEEATTIEQEKNISKETDSSKEVAVKKAGKRSHKALEAAAELAEKEQRKQSKKETETHERPKQKSNPTRSKLARQGKKIQKSAQLIDQTKQYDLSEAINLVKKTSHVKFDATVEIHINLNVDPRHADQNIRDNLVLPAGTGKKIKVAVLTDDDKLAKQAGADIAGNDELLTQLDKGLINFDILIATPMLMAKLGKYARMLGPRGLMPNPKSGTVTTDINKAVKDAKAGRVEYRVDSNGIIHLGVGKVSFSESQLLENIQSVVTSIKNNKPSSVKSNYFKAFHLTTTMGPSINVNLSSVN